MTMEWLKYIDKIAGIVTSLTGIVIFAGFFGEFTVTLPQTLTFVKWIVMGIVSGSLFYSGLMTLGISNMLK